MKKMLSRSMMALALAAVVAGGWSMARGDDPRIDGIYLHPTIEPDPMILSGPPRGGSARPTPTPTGNRGGTNTATATGTATGTSPAGPEDAGPVDTTPYTINMIRPWTAGSAFDMQSNGELTITDATTAAGAATPTQTADGLKFELAGRLDVSAVLPDGSLKDYTLKVSKFTVDGKEVVAAGKVITAKKDKGFTFDFGGVTPDDKAKVVLGMLEDPLSPGDEAMSSKDPHKVGDTWALNGDALAKFINKGGATKVDAKDASGQMAFKKIEMVNGGKAFRVEWTVTASNLKDEQGAPESSSLTLKGNSVFPADAAVPPSEMTQVVDKKLHWSSPSSRDQNIHGSLSLLLSPVK